jgi:periplasmic copper chaperone A
MKHAPATSRAARPWTRDGLLVGAVAAGLLVLSAAPAAAHVTVTTSTTAAGATALVRMEVPHGCEGSATTDLAVRMPEGVSELTADDTERWSAETTADSVTFHTGSPLPDALRDEVVFSVRLPDEPGAELVFPVVQRCEEGESAWTEVAGDDASRAELDMPAPVIVVTGATGSDGTEEAAAMVAGRGDGTLMTVGAAGLLAVGCVASGAVLVLRRRRG